MRLKLAGALLALSVVGGHLQGQDSAATPRADSARISRLQATRAATIRLINRSGRVLKRAADVVFDADSMADDWSHHDDRASTALRAVAPVAFWFPVTAVAAEPMIWADEAQDRHRLNAQYAQSATTALALGFLVSRTAKHFVHRSRRVLAQSPMVATRRSTAPRPRTSGVVLSVREPPFSLNIRWRSSQSPRLRHFRHSGRTHPTQTCSRRRPSASREQWELSGSISGITG